MLTLYAFLLHYVVGLLTRGVFRLQVEVSSAFYKLVLSSLVLSQFGYSVGADSVSQSVQRLVFLFAIRSKKIQLLIKRYKIFLLFKTVPVVHM